MRGLQRIGAVVALVAGCRGAAPGAAPTPTATATATATWSYQIASASGGEELAVEGTFDRASEAFVVDRDATPFVRSVEVADGASWRAVAEVDGRWDVPCARGCRVRYRFRLRAAAVALDDPEVAIASGEVVVAPPSTWLLRPAVDSPVARIRLTSDPPLVSAMHRHDAVTELDAAELDGSGFVVFGPARVRTLESGTSRVDVAIASAPKTLDDAAVLALARADVDAVARYFGRFPVDQLLLVVLAKRAAGPSRGVTLGGGGASVLVQLADDGSLSRALVEEWVPTHEMFHVGMPDLPRVHSWLSEGLASYLEPFARARAGMISADKVWRELVEGLPQGLPAPGDEGLDVTHTWGRTYWGGTLFCLLADVRIREQTAGRASLDDAMRAIARAGGTVLAHWPLARWLAAGDEATGTDVLGELYARMAHAPVGADLDALWKKLGVAVDPGGVRFDDAAPLASIRRAMTAPTP